MSDQYIENVALLIHGDGATSGNDTTTPIVDVMGNPITKGGNTALSITQSQFGGSSIYFDGTNSTFTVPASTKWNLSSIDYTIDFWAYTVVAAGQTFIARRDTSTSGWVFASDSIRAKINGSWSDVQISWSPASINTWHHYALVKSGSVIIVYIDGTSVGTKTGVTSVDDLPGQVLRFGSATDAGENYLNGYLDDIRLSPSIVRYSSNFTPPTAAFPDDGPRPISIRVAALAMANRDPLTTQVPIYQLLL